jgi:hypothetical protein
VNGASGLQHFCLLVTFSKFPESSEKLAEKVQKTIRRATQKAKKVFNLSPGGGDGKVISTRRICRLRAGSRRLNQ